MKLSVEDSVRKRMAIQNLSIEFNYAKTSEDGYTYFKLNVTKNLSDFKEGDSLILHKGEYKAGQECTLYDFDEDDNIIISVYTPSSIINKEMWSGKDLILDKNSVDLRQNVYSNFYYPLNSELEYWGEQLINNVKDVELVNKDECNEDLKETEEFFSLSFTEKQREAILNSMAAKDYYLIQGPPGTGKSFVLATIILEEIGYFNNRVAIIGPNHLAINNALMQLIKIEPSYSNSCVKVGQPYNGKGLEIKRDNKTYKIHNLNRIPTDVFNKYEDGIACGLTPHSLYTKRARGLEYDTLIIDEAGQVTIPLALMAMQNGKKVILAGDHKQLSPIIVSDKIPDKLKKSIFQRLMNDNNHTLLEITFIMQEPICNFVSDLFY